MERSLSGSTTRVLVVEDDRVVRDGLVTALGRSGVEVTVAVGTAEQALAVLGEAQPDVVLVDLGLPGMPGHQLIRELRRRAPDLAILVLTIAETPEDIVRAIEAGASGYLLKDTPLAAVGGAVEQVRHGLMPLSPRMARHLLATAHRRAEEEHPDFSLTQREQEILGLLVRGHTYASCALALDVAVGTVQTHVKNLYRKLEVCTKAEAASLAVRHGLVEDA